ncbi:protein kinase [Streptomyces tirandamycinicus]|uniref:Serine/threonine protein kinase n=1 Tax=Streptomyces tirandamycinicus TaxID=2174846 RepID=A0A2S1T348_9ACTN|nr:protein kinase [Streptomyces tirandamycinicus]AWI33099.1 serine/threonine protein kinase [Streptomyces tirandamycinicus]
MDDYAGRVLADRYRLPLPPSDEYELVETRAFDTYSGQEVLVRQVPLPEVVEAEVLDDQGGTGLPSPRRASGRTTRRPTDPAVRRAVEAAQAAAQIPDHPRLDQVFDVFAEDGSLWIVSELVAARPLAAMLAERPLNPYRAAEIGADVLTALRALHAHGWTHRNITVRTVLVCDDGRVVLTGLAAGAAEEALCGYAPVPDPEAGIEEAEPVDAQVDPPVHAPVHAPYGSPQGPSYEPRRGPSYEPSRPAGPVPPGPGGQRPPGPAAHEAEPHRTPPPHERPPAPASPPDPAPGPVLPGRGAAARYVPPAYGPGFGGGRDDARAARAGAIAAYRAGTRAAARISEENRRGPARGEGGPDEAVSAATAAGEGDRTALPPAGGPAGIGRLHHPGVRDERYERGAAEGSGTPPGSVVPPPRSGAALPAQRAALPAPQWWSRPGDGAAEYAHDTGYPRGAYDARDAQVPHDAHDAEYPHDAHDAGDAGAAGNPHDAYDAHGTHDTEGTHDTHDTHDTQGAGYPDEHRAPGDGDGPYGGAPQDPPGGPRRARLAGVWRDGPGPASDGSAPVPAGGGAAGYGGNARDALRADAQRGADAYGGVRPVSPGGRWDEVVAAGAPPAEYRGPTTPLAAERARQTRIAVVGAVTERWAPEQAGPVHENWQLAPPIGPATDLWALGALLYRAVQGHAPYPEENAAELVQLVCAEPPAFAEECGPLRPVVESLLRQDPTERPDFEELRGWLRSLVRSAPEPDAGAEVVPLPSVDGTRLPVVRRRGELVRRRRGGSAELRGRHRHKKAREPRESREPREHRDPGGRRDRPGRSPRSLGRMLLVLILLALAAAVAYAVLFMPKAGSGSTSSSAPVSSSSAPASSSPRVPDRPGGPAGEAGGGPSPDGKGPQTSAPAVDLAEGYVVRVDPEGFRIGVDKTWQRRPVNDSGQVRYIGGDFTLIVVPGRDSVGENGSDPMAYQRDRERELQPFRDSSWSTASGLRRIDVGKQAMAEGQFTWQDSTGREVYVRNLAMIVGDRYHVLQVIGPEGQRDKVTEIYQQATAAYRAAS